jgi:hypothetical protein
VTMCAFMAMAADSFDNLARRALAPATDCTNEHKLVHGQALQMTSADLLRSSSPTMSASNTAMCMAGGARLCRWRRVKGGLAPLRVPASEEALQLRLLRARVQAQKY